MVINDPLVAVHTISQLLSFAGLVDKHRGLHVITDYINEGASILYPFRSDHFLFFIVQEGRLSIKLNLLEYCVEKHNILFFTPNTVRQFLQVSPDSKIATIVFTSDYLSGTNIHRKNIEAFNFLSSQADPLLSVNDRELHTLITLLKLLETKLEEAESTTYREEIMINIFTSFIYEIAGLYQKQESSAEIKGSRKEELTFRFLKVLPQYFKDERSVQAYARMLNITPKYLSQTIKDVTGKTAGEFIDEMVMIEAKILLTDPALTIAQVAEHLNFNDQFIFSKFFKNQSGLSPSKYRQSA